jgi:hypothetical protein
MPVVRLGLGQVLLGDHRIDVAVAIHGHAVPVVKVPDRVGSDQPPVVVEQCHIRVAPATEVPCGLLVQDQRLGVQPEIGRVLLHPGRIEFVIAEEYLAAGRHEEAALMHVAPADAAAVETLEGVARLRAPARPLVRASSLRDGCLILRAERHLATIPIHPDHPTPPVAGPQPRVEQAIASRVRIAALVGHEAVDPLPRIAVERRAVKEATPAALALAPARRRLKRQHLRFAVHGQLVPAAAHVGVPGIARLAQQGGPRGLSRLGPRRLFHRPLQARILGEVTGVLVDTARHPVTPDGRDVATQVFLRLLGRRRPECADVLALPVEYAPLAEPPLVAGHIQVAVLVLGHQTASATAAQGLCLRA